MEIRWMRDSDDKRSISRVYEESWKYAYQGIVPTDYLKHLPKGHWVDWLRQSVMYTLVMLDGTDIIGTCSYGAPRFVNRDGYGEIVSLYLLPDYMGKGLGTLLLQTAVEACVREGWNDIFLWVLEDNHRAQRFYEAFGFAASETYLCDTIGGKELRERQYVYHVAEREVQDNNQT